MKNLLMNIWMAVKTFLEALKQKFLVAPGKKIEAEVTKVEDTANKVVTDIKDGV